MARLAEIRSVIHRLVDAGLAWIVALKLRQAQELPINPFHQQKNALIIPVDLELDKPAGRGKTWGGRGGERAKEVVGKFVTHQRSVDVGRIQNPVSAGAHAEKGDGVREREGQ